MSSSLLCIFGGKNVKFAVLIMVTSILLFGCNQTVSNTKYDQYTIKHSLTTDYTESDYERSAELIDAIRENDTNQIDKILDSNPEINCPNIAERKNDYNIITPLEVACENGDLETVKKLIKKGAYVKHIEGEECSFAGYASPLSFVLFKYHSNDYEMVKLLLQEGVTPNDYLNNENEEVSIILALQMVTTDQIDPKALINTTKIFKLLEKNGADLDAKSKFSFGGGNALIYAAMGNNLELVKYLVEEKDKDVNWPDNTGGTPLMLSAFTDDYPVVTEYLLEKGADKTIVDQFGKTAMDYAEEEGTREAIKLLK